MLVEELKLKLDLLGVNPSFYSLDGNLSLVGTVLYHSYGDWIVFDLDERGNKTDEKVFKSENEACDYIYQKFFEYVRLFG